MKLDESSFQIIQHLDHEPVNPHDLYRSNGFSFSRATFYRRLEELKQLGLVEWRVGKARLTEKGLKLRCLLNGSKVDFKEKEKDEGISNGPITESNESPNEDRSKLYNNRDFRLYEADKLRNFIDEGFIYVDYPQTSFILKILMELAGIEEKAKTNVEKFKLLKSHDFKVKLAINHFENSPKQLLIFLEELIKEGKISALYVGVKNERKALANKKLVEFLQSHDFENERFKLPKESVTLFPLFLIAIIGVILIVALRSGYEHAGIMSILMIVYFMRSLLFKEIREIS
jgi:DNA-binding HxlR family transcriptional regulator